MAKQKEDIYLDLIFHNDLDKYRGSAYEDFKDKLRDHKVTIQAVSGVLNVVGERHQPMVFEGASVNHANLTIRFSYEADKPVEGLRSYLKSYALEQLDRKGARVIQDMRCGGEMDREREARERRFLEGMREGMGILKCLR